MQNCAIVILNYNGEEMLKRFLPSVIKFSQSEIWVIDNASQDQSIAILEKDFPQVQLISLSENFGYAGGYNWGLEQLRGKYEFFILLNSDVEVTEGWDCKLLEAFQRDEKIAALQPKILSAQNPKVFDYAGAGGGFLDTLYYPYCRGRIWNVIEEDKGQYDDFCLVDWASGACLAIRSACFFEHGGFDAHFFAHMEEIDLCVRMQQAGWKIAYTGDSVVYHLGGATLDRSSPKKLYLNIKNSISLIYKAESTFNFAVIFILKFVVEILAALAYILNGKKEFGKAILRGYDDFFESKEQFLKTKEKKKFSKKGPSYWIYWDFWVNRKKTFDRL